MEVELVGRSGDSVGDRNLFLQDKGESVNLEK